MEGIPYLMTMLGWNNGLVVKANALKVTEIAQMSLSQNLALLATRVKVHDTMTKKLGALFSSNLHFKYMCQLNRTSAATEVQNEALSVKKQRV